MSQINYRPLYFKNLNSLRFMSFLMVFVAHAFTSYSQDVIDTLEVEKVKHFFSFGRLGVDCFFVLSSFLITWKFFEEDKLFNKINIFKFYMRRGYRIWPLYFLITALGFTYYYISSHFNSPISELPNIGYFMSFTLNFYMADNGISFLFFLTFLWSISVEEQFYLFWPFLFQLFNRRILPLCVLLLMISILYRWYNINDSHKIYLNTVSVLGNFSIGAIIAYLAYFKSKIFNFITRIGLSFKIFIYILFFVFLASYHKLLEFDYFIIFERLIISLFFSFIIIEQSFSENKLIDFGKSSFINYLGKISYGLYCYHGVVITGVIYIVQELNLKVNCGYLFIIQPLIILTITIFVSHISYVYFEKYFLLKKNKYSLSLKHE